MEQLRYVMELTDSGEGQTRSVHDDITVVVVEFEYDEEWPPLKASGEAVEPPPSLLELYEMKSSGQGAA